MHLFKFYFPFNYKFIGCKRIIESSMKFVYIHILFLNPCIRRVHHYYYYILLLVLTTDSNVCFCSSVLNLMVHAVISTRYVNNFKFFNLNNKDLYFVYESNLLWVSFTNKSFLQIAFCVCKKPPR